jgi:hypothetical protein
VSALRRARAGTRARSGGWPRAPPAPPCCSIRRSWASRAGTCRRRSLDVVARHLERLAGEVRRVGTHVGDEADGALAGDVDALVEPLGGAHGALGAEAQARAAACCSVEVMNGGGGRLVVRLVSIGDAVGRRGIDVAGDGAQEAGRALALLILVDVVLMSVRPASWAATSPVTSAVRSGARAAAHRPFLARSTSSNFSPPTSTSSALMDLCSASQAF